MAQLLGLPRQLSPLLLGTQVGQVLGMLAQQVLGQYDVAVPRAGPGSSCSSFPTSRRSSGTGRSTRGEFRTYVALHEVTHRFEFAQPWARARFRELVDDFLSTLTIDVEGMQSRLAGLDPAIPRRSGSSRDPTRGCSAPTSTTSSG